MTLSEHSQKQEELDNLLAKLMCEEVSDVKKITEGLETLKSIYLDETGERNTFRHDYSHTTRAMFTVDQDEENAGYQEYEFYTTKIETLVANIGAIITKAEEDGCQEILIPLNKLYDHINLELVRANFNAKINDMQDQRLKDLTSQIKEAQSSAETHFDRAMDEIEAAKLEAKNEIEQSRNKAQRDNITVLGIFTGIVVTFVAGLTFSSSVLQNIDNVSIYRLFAMAVVIAFFFINIIGILLEFLCKISGVENDGLKKLIKYANILFIILLAAVIIARFALILPPYK